MAALPPAHSVTLEHNLRMSLQVGHCISVGPALAVSVSSNGFGDRFRTHRAVDGGQLLVELIAAVDVLLAKLEQPGRFRRLRAGQDAEAGLLQGKVLEVPSGFLLDSLKGWASSRGSKLYSGQ